MMLESHYVKGNVFKPIVVIGFINFVLMMQVLLLSASIFARPGGVLMDFPTDKEALYAVSQQVIIMVTGENVIYINNHVVTLNELRRFLAQGAFRRDAVSIKVDRRSSMGRVADILELCRGILGASVNVSTIL